jgi:hypothetical protein
MRIIAVLAVLSVAAIASLAVAQNPEGGGAQAPMVVKEMPFGGPADIAFARQLWSAMQGYQSWKLSSGYYAGTSPHGAFLRMYWNIIDVGGKPYSVIIKDNFGGDGATVDTVSADPAEYLVAVTVMVQREPGYDPEDGNWFWVKYAPDGAIDKTPAGVAMAGRVAKGMPTGCIACHGTAKTGDFFFSNDS